MTKPAPLQMAEARIALSHLDGNVRRIRQLTEGKVRIMGVVKANAYGHGANRVAASLEAIGITDFGVANIQEAVSLRTEGGLQKKAAILAFSSPLMAQIESYLRHDIEMTICSFDILRAAEATAAACGRTLSVHVKVDTGMGRLGLPPAETMELLRAIRNSPYIDLKGIYTHFAEGSKPGGYTSLQLDRFKGLVTQYESESGQAVCKHTASSGAILCRKDSWFDMVRPGIILYGYLPDPEMSSPIQVVPIMQLEAKVVFIKNANTGDTVSYNRTWSAPGPRRIATIAAGYADGYPRSISNKGSVIINDKSFKQIGTVTMDQIMVDLGTNHDVKSGDNAILFGWEGPSADDIAQTTGSISYEVLCSVSSRVKRVYL
ncbi:MAG: alanine racemase [Chlorobium sp.]|uniref:alanine racemase n=1 Tax=Chlorobium sp. TaxID=1095 RepID=UPI0025B83A79|nr:alanine racemase [Chlorobium sp.]MCF8215310.1 alanine racemase [Chlorobium sp.]MCF8270147.1 alanine racemase [Chlorobium sp.]MCF8286517.1 alanine racemase [Chlorobium sp.]MCF8290115.1 alanine racemase [Chlorobium sp.]MCF8384187.1 alanine racemase [Chlorobium sp.]